MRIFTSFNALASHFNQVAQTAYRQECRNLLNQMGASTRHVAANSLGTYQTGIGPFPAWNPLQPSTLRSKAARGWGLNGNPDTPLYATGALAGSINFLVTSDSEVEIGTDKQEALYLEIGRFNMAPRPIFGPAALRTVPLFQNQIGIGLAAAIAGVHITANGP